MLLLGNWVFLFDVEIVVMVMLNFVVFGIFLLIFIDKIFGVKLFFIMNKMINFYMCDLNYVLVLYMVYYLMYMY